MRHLIKLSRFLVLKFGHYWEVNILSTVDGVDELHIEFPVCFEDVEDEPTMVAEQFSLA
jgi:hypothetical protein